MKHPFRRSRRAFLAGAGAAVALPFLESVGSRAQQEAVPRRFLTYYVPNGIHHGTWMPSGVGLGYRASYALEPLDALRGDVSILTGLDNAPANIEDGGAHFRGTSSLLSCVPIRKGIDDIANGITADQLMARAAPQTRFSSLQLGMAGGSLSGACGGTGFGCIYLGHISWSGPTTPLSKSTNPQHVFDRLFGGFDRDASEAQIARRRLYRQSVLDYVRDDARTLRGRVSRADEARLDEYLTGIRELEQRVEGTASCDPGERPDGGTYLERLDQMLDLMTLALRCDLTRVITFMALNAGASDGTVPYTWVQRPDGTPLTQPKHEYSHHQRREEKLEALGAINRWEVGRFASLVQRLKAVETGPERTLLDETAALFTSEYGDPNAHDAVNVPAILAGRCGGRLNPQGVVAHAPGTPWANLILTLTQHMGVELDRFGDSTGTLTI